MAPQLILPKLPKKGRRKIFSPMGRRRKSALTARSLGTRWANVALKKEKEEEAAKAKGDASSKPKAADTSASAKIAVADDSDSDHDPICLFMS